MLGSRVRGRPRRGTRRAAMTDFEGRSIPSLARCEDKGQGSASTIGGQVHLRSQAAARPAKCMIVQFAGCGPFLRAPATCW